MCSLSIEPSTYWSLSTELAAILATVTFAFVMFAVTMASLASVVVIEIAAEPSKFAVPVTSPPTAIALVVARAVAVSALPVRSPVKPSAAVMPPALISARS